MSIQPDITVYAPDRGVLLVAEVKAIHETSPQWAADLRGELIRHMPIVRTAPYFLIAVPDRFFLWRQDHPRGGDDLPDYVEDTRTSLDEVVDLDRVRLDSVTQPSLEMIVATWLQRIALSRPNGRNGHGAPRWLADSGLADAIRGGAIHTAEAA